MLCFFYLIFTFSTRGHVAYENTREKIGRLVQHLQKFLTLEESIETVFGKVREGENYCFCFYYF